MSIRVHKLLVLDRARQVLQKAHLKLSRLQKVIADGMYTKNGLVDGVKQQLGFTLEIVTRDKEQKGFVVLPKRWTVEPGPHSYLYFGTYP